MLFSALTLIVLISSTDCQSIQAERLCCADDLWSRENESVVGFDVALMNLVHHDPDHSQNYLPLRLEGDSLIQWCEWHFHDQCEVKSGSRLKRYARFNEHALTESKPILTVTAFLVDIFHEHDANRIQIFIHPSDYLTGT